jgi:hypothetical protein
MTERTSHLAAFWIGAAISNVSIKAGSTTVKRIKVDGSVATISINFPIGYK